MRSRVLQGALVAGLIVLEGAAGLAAERPIQEAGGASAAAKGEEQVYQAKGVVLAISSEEKEVRIKHEEVPGYMPAMAMWFKVREDKELKGLKVGDEVRFRITATADDGWIDQIQTTQIQTTRVTQITLGPPPGTGA